MSQSNKQAQIESTFISKAFYGYVDHALEASKPQMSEHAKQLQAIIDKSGQGIILVAVNKLYKSHCVCRHEGQLYSYRICDDNGGWIRREHGFRGYGGDAWEQAPNFVQLKDLELGQMELF
ncbi:hypothetical protein [Paenibacillus sp. IHBB 10380]|uniref:hypothetical protein n=1 Tax=Paenibacillus sp. IHBB 10380 TaxID=1566358 RepID=UPI0005CFB066|nr:hypothetical protein [Paenibacillus sp. IHBB 10380]AJS59871.1 hypothetical protein UB51_16860 [Paenibacillus sp. IHBB 10380]